MNRRAAAIVPSVILVLTSASCGGGDVVTRPETSVSPISADEARMLMRDALLIPGVSFLAADPSCSCAIVGVANDAADSQVRDFAKSNDVPDSALKVKRQDLFEPLWSLRDGIRPIKGGLQIENELRAKCTMFGTVFHRGLARKGLLTNSHCTRSRMTVDGIEFFQAGGAAFSSDFVAREVLDPGAVTQAVEPSCPTDSVCRRSDAVFAQFDTSTVGIVGRIARTANRCTDTCTIEMASNDPGSSLPVVGASGQAVDVDMQVNKIGRTSGWTLGTVTEVCADLPWAGTKLNGSPVILLCQNLVRGKAGRGDSGSPVFTVEDDFSGATYVGILWGGNSTSYSYSPIEGIESDLGVFDYHE